MIMITISQLELLLIKNHIKFIEEETTLSEHNMLRGHARKGYPVQGFRPINAMQR